MTIYCVQAEGFDIKVATLVFEVSNLTRKVFERHIL